MWLERIVLALTITGAVCDMAARAAQEEVLWRTGAYLIGGAVIMVWCALAVQLGRRQWRAAFASGIAALLLTLAFWLRGAPGVPPDAPLIGAELLSCALLLLAQRRALTFGRDLE